MEKRPYGKSGDMLSVIGFGGIVVKDVSSEEAGRLVGEAIERGINYFDVAPAYGNAQQMLGPALAPYRDDVFLACKSNKRDAGTSEQELHESLRLLKTDHFDLYQLHAMTTQDDLDRVLAPGGALETLAKARDEGKARHLGFSAHNVDVALKLMDAFEFDSILFPVNFVTWHEGGFGPQVVETAREKGMSVLALKAAARAKLPHGVRTYEKCWYDPVTDPELASLAVRWTLSQPVTAAVPPGDPALWRMTAEIGERYTPLTEEEAEAVRREAGRHTPIFAR